MPSDDARPIPTIEEYAAKLAADAPPFTDAQRIALSRIFSNPADTRPVAA